MSQYNFWHRITFIIVIRVFMVIMVILVVTIIMVIIIIMVIRVIRQTWYLSFFLNEQFKFVWKFTPKKRVNRDISNPKPYIFGVLIHLIGTICQFSYIYAYFTHFQRVNIVWYYQKLNHITSIGPKTHPQSELLPEW